MGPFGDGWAVALNGVVLTSGCSGDTAPVDTIPVTNLVTNPSFEASLDGWESLDADWTATRTGDESYVGGWSVEVEAAATTGTDGGIGPDTLITVVEGEHVWASGRFLPAGGVARDAAVTVVFYDITDTPISTVPGTPVTVPVGVWTHVGVDAVAPPDATSFGLQLFWVNPGSVPAGTIMGWIDAAMATIGDQTVDYFDGDTLDTSYYGYAWDGEANASSSTRTPCVLIYGSIILEALNDTPKGLGHPEIRTEDTTYAQRDGVTHWNDYYGPRLITIAGVSLHPPGHCDDANSCVTVRENRMLLSQAWKRQCNDIEIVLYPPCEAGEDVAQRAVTGPYGIVGRPRVFESEWEYRDTQIADVLLRFDGTDHRIYVLDACGTPGLVESYQMEAGTFETCAATPWCFNTDGGGVCFDTPVEGATEPLLVTIAGTECVNPTLTFYPLMTRPRVINLTTGDWIGYNAIVSGSPVVVDTLNGTATQDGQDVTANLIGSLTFKMNPGEYEIQTVSFGLDDDGYVDFSYRPTVLIA